MTLNDVGKPQILTFDNDFVLLPFRFLTKP